MSDGGVPGGTVVGITIKGDAVAVGGQHVVGDHRVAR